MATTLVDNLTLGVHHVVVLEETLADAEVVLLDLLLRALYGLVEHAVLQYLAFLEAHLVHHRRETVGGEETHQVVLQRDEEDGRPGVTLTPCTTTQLAVYTARLVTLGTEDRQPTCGLDLGRELDVGTTPCHVGGDGHDAGLTCLGDDLGLLLVELSVEDIMGDLAQGEHLAQQLRDLDRGRTYQHGASTLYEADDLLDDGGVLLTSRLVDTVVEVVARDGAVGGDDHDVQLIDIPELASLRLGCPGHPRELVIHAEVVLQRDRGEGLRGGLHVDALLGLNGLVQPIGVATAVHDTTRLLVDDHHLAVHNDVLVVLLKEGVGLEELVDRVYALALDGIIGEQRLLASSVLLGREALGSELGQERSDVGKDEEAAVIGALRQEVDPLVRELDAILLLVDDEVELIGDDMHLAHVVGHVLLLDLEHPRLDTRLAEVLDEGLALGHTLVGAEE